MIAVLCVQLQVSVVLIELEVAALLLVLRRKAVLSCAVVLCADAIESWLVGVFSLLEDHRFVRQDLLDGRDKGAGFLKRFLPDVF